jgi:hypothetical protein
MVDYKVVLEISVSAKDPLDAAKKVEDWIREDGGFQYYVQDENEKIYSVDLGEEDDDAVLPTDNYFPLIN